MSNYRVVCTCKEEAYEPNAHSHIVGLGTGDARGCSRLWTIGEIYVALDNGEVFYTTSPSSLAISTVRNHICPTCRIFYTVQLGDEAISDNNLHGLPTCE